MHTNRTFLQCGATLIGILVGSALLSLMIASTINLSTFGRSGPASDKSQSPARLSLALSESLAAKVALGGGYVSTSDTDKGIQICALNENGSHCGRFSNQHHRFCIVFPSRVGGDDSSSIDVSGVRLFGGVLYERRAVRIDLKTFDVTSFCANHNNWLPMSDKAYLSVNSIRFCRFQGGAIGSLSHDFEAFCPSVLQNNMEPNQYWVTVMNVKPQSQEMPSFVRMSLHALWNPTKVSTP